MKRFILLAAVGVSLSCFAGCHHWREKHFTRASYNCCDPCGGAESYAGPYDGMPVATAQSFPIAPAKVIPGPPGTVVSTPQR